MTPVTFLSSLSIFSWMFLDSFIYCVNTSDCCCDCDGCELVPIFVFVCCVNVDGNASVVFAREPNGFGVGCCCCDCVFVFVFCCAMPNVIGDCAVVWLCVEGGVVKGDGVVVFVLCCCVVFVVVVVV